MKKNDYRRRYERRRSWRSVITVLAAIVVFCTTYALILPAITMEKEPSCGLEEHIHGEDCYADSVSLSCSVAELYVHTHGDSCYLESGELLCPLQEVSAHTHTDACYTVIDAVHEHGEECYTLERGELICTQEETAGHSHGAECYEEQTILACTTPEGEDHTHTEDCWKTESALVCQQEETPGHAHGDACYAWSNVLTCEASAGETVFSDPVLTCGKAEIVLHTHSDGCYGGDGSLVCGKQEITEHVHSEACLNTSGEKTLICTQEEHTHDPVLCYIDSDADVETEEQWKDTLPKKLSGVWAEDLLAVAESQLGYTESQYNVQVDAEGNIRGYTRYGAWYGEPYSDWNAIFVSFCLNYAEITREDFSYESNAERWITVLSAREQYAAAAEYTPVPGDLVFLDLDDNGYADTVAIVKSLEQTAEKTELKVIQGDTENRAVEEVAYELPGDILGYGILPENPNPDGGKETTEATEAEPAYYCGLEEHVHEDACYDAEGNVICEKAEHTHTEECTQEPEDGYFCGNAEHEHTILCTANLTGLSEEDRQMVERVILLIDEMPSADEIDAKIEEFEAAEDYDGEEAYYTGVTEQVCGAYRLYKDLSDEQKALVINADKLLELEYIWSMQTYVYTTDGPVIYQINSYVDSSSEKSVMVFGGTVAEKVTYKFLWWYAVVVEDVGNGVLQVTQVHQPGQNNDKSNVKATTANGFVLLFYYTDTIPDVKVGDYVTVHFTVPTTGVYKASGYGTVSFSSSIAKINSAAPTVDEYTSTRDFIELNIYDYNYNINKYWDTAQGGNNKYPGFQWNGGAYSKTGTSYRTYNADADKGVPDYYTKRNKIDGIDFGNSMITNFSYGSTSSYAKSVNAVDVTGNGGLINTVDVGDYGVTNRPTGFSVGVEAMSRTLIDGYPALVDGTSLSYLFNPEDDTYSAVTKLNTESVDGLFLQNPTTGEYSYNSRENHAQYANNFFTRYDQIITPNFITYPFGNFLPLNSISDLTQATQVGAFNYAGGMEQYVDGIKAQLRAANDSLGSGDWKYTTRKQLITMLEEYQENWDYYTYNGSWSDISPANAIRDYFQMTGDNPSDDVGFVTQAHLDNMYNIDWDVDTNFFFGMEMKMNFYQPKGGMTGQDTDGDGDFDYPMEFYFTGDDDVWVYIDNVLFLDLSGIHRHVGGKIDFVNGKVYYYYLDISIGDVHSGSLYKTYTFKELLEAAGASTDGLNAKGTFADYTTHSFNFYYMERGSGSSVCRLNFNFPLLRQNTLSVEKALTDDDSTAAVEALGNPDFLFQVLDADDHSLFLPDGWAYTLYDSDGVTKLQEIVVTGKYADGRVQSMNIKDANGTVICTETYDADGKLSSRTGSGLDKVLRIGENGIFKLKAGQRAEFVGLPESWGKYYVRELLEETVVGQYGQITVSGTAADTKTVSVGGISYTGAESPPLDMTNGSSTFRIENKITTANLGTLSISKDLSEYSGNGADKTFDIEVTLDGKKLPVGTAYTVGGESRTVETEGIVSIKVGEKAVIRNILAGTRFTVKETSESAEGYIVTYTTSDGYTVEQVEGGVSGILKTKASVELVVNNSEKGDDVKIPVTKTLSAFDGKAHTYTFHLVEVTDSTGATVKDGSVDYPLSVTLTEGTVEQAFNLTYKLDATQTLPLKHYYRITEDPAADSLTNSTTYVVEVTITETNDGNIDALVTKVWKDGEVYTGDKLAYTNSLVGTLSLSKTVSGIDTDRGFKFTIQLDPGTSGLTELPTSYPVVFYQKDGTTKDVTLSLIGGEIGLTDFKSGEKAVISGIPIGTVWTITEESADGFKTTYTVTVGEDQTSGDGTTTSGSIVLEDTEVAYVNTAMYELPETGGAGTCLYTMGGLLLMISAGVLLLYSQRRRRKEDI